MKYLLGDKLDVLRKNHLSGKQLAAYFDEDRWLEWIGLKEDPAPFSIGMRLEEPIDDLGDWQLGLFLRGKAESMLIEARDYGSYPAGWDDFSEKVENEERRLAAIFPWIADEDEDGRLKTKLTEDEAWMFLTEASETLVALGIEILLPSWWEAKIGRASCRERVYI